MTVESNVTGIEDLNASLPVDTDPVQEAAEHLRNIKTAVKSSVQALEVSAEDLSGRVLVLEENLAAAESDLNVLGNVEFAFSDATQTTALRRLNVTGTGLTLTENAEGDFTLNIAATGTVHVNTDYCPGYQFYLQADNTFLAVQAVDLSLLYRTGKRVVVTRGSVAYYGTIIDYDTSGVPPLVAFTFTVQFDNGYDMVYSSAGELMDSICFTTSDSSWAPVADSTFGTTLISAITSGIIGGVVYWVAVGFYGKIAYSTDKGVTWTAVVLGDGNSLISIAYNHVAETFLAGAGDGTLYWSDDVINWVTQPALPQITGFPHILYYEHQDLWFVVGKASNVSSTWAAPDSSSMSFTKYDPSIVNAFVTGVTLHERIGATPNIWIGGESSIEQADVATDTAVSSVINHSSFTTALLSIIHTPTDSNLTFEARVTGEIYLYEDSAVSSLNDDSAYGYQFYDFAWSETLKTVVAVGTTGSIVAGMYPGSYATDNVLQQIPNGFATTATLTGVHWDETDKVFIAVANNGQICRSTTGIS